MDAEPAAQLLENIRKDMRVIIELSRSKKTLEGNVTEIIDKSQQFNENGIEVKIKNNYCGNVKKIIESTNFISKHELIQKIQSHENKNFELKSSFKYDVNLSNRNGMPTKNEVLGRKISEEIAAFMNTDGGMICLGVDDQKNILGLENDYKLQSNYLQTKDLSKIRDKFLQEIIQSIKNYLNDDLILGLIDFSIISVNDKDVCCINVKKSPEPIFVKTKVNCRIDGNDKNEIIWNCWIRLDVGIRKINFDKFMKYWKTRD
ncbi:MAG: helix-turn-helix domain-containing protein [Nitrosopumilus sp.]